VDIKLREGKGYKYLAVHKYVLFEYTDFTTLANKKEVERFLSVEREKIKLALEQLKDIEKMSEEL